MSTFRTPKGMNDSTKDTLPLHLAPHLPLLLRLSLLLQLWALKFASGFGFILMRRILQPTLTHAYLPTYTKTYPCRPNLENRIFIPGSHKKDVQASPNSKPDLLPLYLDIHGGGFALCAPQFDDEFCTLMANRFSMVVVSLNYRKAPLVSFPVPIYDIAALVAAVLDDPTLPVDKTRVAIGGFSAGGNLALSAAQLPELRGKINAVVPWYPVTDWSVKSDVKLRRRAYRKEGDKDMLGWMGKLFNCGYVPAGTDLKDPLLSVGFADREALPEWVFCIAAEYDMLAWEAGEMMERLAGVDGMAPDGEGRQEDINGEESTKYAFERGTYRWRLVRDVEHGFSHNQMESGEKEEKRLVVMDKIMDEVGGWLVKGPFAE